jgi:hypothetical protein
LPKNIKKIFFGKHFFAQVEQFAGKKRDIVRLSDFIESLSPREKEELDFLKEEVPESSKLEGFIFTGEEAKEVCDEKRRA